MYIRKAIRVVHLWLGLISGTILIIVAITGCILAFEDEIRDATQHKYLYVKNERKTQLSPHAVIANIKAQNTKIKLTQLRYYDDPEKAIQGYTKEKKIYAVNPYTGAIIGFRNQQSDWLSVILSLHRNLLLGNIGKEIIFYNVCIFLVMLITGLVLWFPKKIKQLKQVLTIKKGASVKRRNYDLHSVLGFYALIPLLIIAITGINMTLHTNSEKKPKSTIVNNVKTGTSTIDRAFTQARSSNEPIEVLRLGMPKNSTDVISINIRYATTGLRKQTVFLFDQYNAQLLQVDSYKNKSLKDRILATDYEIHTGRIAGIAGKLIAFVAALIAASLPITGFLIWRARNKKKKLAATKVESIRLQAAS